MNPYIQSIPLPYPGAVPWFTRLVAGLSPRGPRFYLTSVRVRFEVGKLALAQLFDRVLRFSHVSIAPTVFHNHLHVHYQKHKRTKPENFLKRNSFSEIREHWIENHFHFLLVFKGLNVTSHKFVMVMLSSENVF